MAKFYYGGQAVMEGVMMRGRNTVAVAVRRPEGDIYVHEEALTPKIYQNKYLRLPFLRGMVLLWEMLVLGTRMMTLSANIATGAVDPTTELATPDVREAEASSEAGASPAPTTGGVSMILPLIVSLTFAIAIFFVGPLLLTSLLRGQIGDGWLNLTLEGVIRLLLLIGYLYLIGRVPDIQRVFGYHGAEHKAINAMEHGDALTVENVRRASRVHTRCGTGFMLLVMVVSIVVFAFIGSPSLLIKIISRIVLVPVVAGIAYELMRLGAANYRYRVVRWLLAPGLALQGLTTREPDDSMIECSIASLQRVLARDTEKQVVEKDKPVVPSDLVTNV
ncbi:membrane protein [Dictyobacter sp. S3.2.2.5]|uniref:Membrane protein n=1 Tax=Dictyobacter halimunensis TaxID=3026934 RepID=A0ABQ6G277_9CHLR|nr:membrane protein [Dictyobacter sp. S3.2.2.5]